MRAFVEIRSEKALEGFRKFLEDNYTFDEARLCEGEGILTLCEAINCLPQPCWPEAGPYPEEQANPLKKKGGLTQKEFACYKNNVLVALMKAGGLSPEVAKPEDGSVPPVSPELEAVRVARLLEWANEKGICLYGPNHNSDKTWGATLGLYSSHGFSRMEDAIEALMFQYNRFCK